jgi:hypothetical protein
MQLEISQRVPLGSPREFCLTGQIPEVFEHTPVLGLGPANVY